MNSILERRTDGKDRRLCKDLHGASGGLCRILQFPVPAERRRAVRRDGQSGRTGFRSDCRPGGTAEDEGAASLNDAEKTRFLYTIKDFDSDPTVTKDYLEKFYITKAKREADRKEPD